MNKIFIVSAFLFVGRAAGQTDTIYTKDYLQRSTSFAWLTLGVETLVQTGGTTSFFIGNSTETTSFPASFVPRVTIGGIHFWGHADFYVTFPLSFLNIQAEPNGFDEIKNRVGIETGARLYPWKIKPGRIVPYTGISFRRHSFEQITEAESFTYGGPKNSRITSPLELGLTYATSKWLIRASAYYLFNNEINYFISPEQVTTTSIDPFSFGFSVTRYWDTDKSMSTDEGVQEVNVLHSILRKEGLLSTWYWGLGPSASFQTSKSDYISNNYPFLQEDLFAGFMPDITFGRFFHKPDMNIGLSYRTLGDRLDGFENSIRLRRHSIMLEVYKNLFNYLGFVPFIGVTGSIENLRANVDGVLYQDTKATIGMIFGWDIRVTKTGTGLLRTNLRWIPDLHLDINEEKLMFDHLEINFIQYVHFIGRKKAYRRI